MVDRLDKEKRSWNMGRVKSRDTQPEIAVRSLLHRMGFRFRLQRKDLPGTPDIVLPRYKTVVFVNGCFWHRHRGCKYATMPATNADAWTKKFERNVARDRENYHELGRMGWKVIVVWQCQIKDSVVLEKRLTAEIKSHDFL